MWFLDSVELHDLSQQHMEITRYEHWPGIFESVCFFANLRWIRNRPFQDPREYLLVPGQGAVRRMMEPNDNPMLIFNRLTKAFWQFYKSMRIFVRTAVSFREFGPPEEDRESFWVVSPPFDRSVCRALTEFLSAHLRISSYTVDDWGGYPSLVPEGRRVRFVANLLGTSVRVTPFLEQRCLLMDIWKWMFGRDQAARNMIGDLRRNYELADPPMVSYAFPVAVKYDELNDVGASPGAYPIEGDDLGYLGEPAV